MRREQHAWAHEALRGGDPLVYWARNVYSQNGEDGILHQLLALVGTGPAPIAVEFGAWDGLLSSNTANLWSWGHVRDRSPRAHAQPCRHAASPYLSAPRLAVLPDPCLASPRLASPPLPSHPPGAAGPVRTCPTHGGPVAARAGDPWGVAHARKGGRRRRRQRGPGPTRCHQNP